MFFLRPIIMSFHFLCLSKLTCGNPKVWMLIILIQLICTKTKTSIQFNKNNASQKYFRQIYCRWYRFYSSLNRLSKFRFMHKYLSATVSRKLNSVKASLLYILPWASFSRKSNTIFFMGKVHVRNKNQSFCKVV